jgi:hypothetical protein
VHRLGAGLPAAYCGRARSASIGLGRLAAALGCSARRRQRGDASKTADLD